MEREENSMPPPIIGVPSYGHAKPPRGYPPSFVVPQSYIRCLEAAGAAPLIVPLLRAEGALRAIYATLDGLLLAGGGDVDPRLYGEEPHPKLRDVDPERDRVELLLLRWAFEDDLPVLAICRGIQVLNVAAGGTLYQDIAAQCPWAMRHNHYRSRPRDYRAHEVNIEPGSRLFHLLGTRRLAVNSMHHQAVKDPAPGLRVSARAEDGLIEGIESSEHRFVVGVQWHPEALAHQDPVMQRLFDGFVEAVRERRAVAVG
jgi:putative glutamine amidotransferase